ncbi:hypothetical protein HanIR_Chr03g0144701 [Helianthus annuus]|nr:hypothetical protein HanIR_Chr03g0144701 [Helianthus annuus]
MHFNLGLSLFKLASIGAFSESISSSSLAILLVYNGHIFFLFVGMNLNATSVYSCSCAFSLLVQMIDADCWIRETTPILIFLVYSKLLYSLVAPRPRRINIYWADVKQKWAVGF